MLIRFCQFFALVVLVVPVLSIVPKLHESVVRWYEILPLFLASFALNGSSLAAGLAWRGYRQLTWLHHGLSVALFVLLLFLATPVAPSAFFLFYIALLHAFAFHALVHGVYPNRAMPWRSRQTWSRRLLLSLTAVKVLLVPLYLFWLHHYMLFPQAAERQHLADMAFVIGAPMTIVAVILGIVYLGVEVLVKIERQSAA